MVVISALIVQQGQAKAVYPPPIHVHRAGAALAVVTALLGAGESNGSRAGSQAESFADRREPDIPFPLMRNGSDTVPTDWSSISG